ncbi:MAG: N-acetylmuramoyl-L-alanine amidase [candidate division KSB1 bacterium]|nr:N-acetylmuramoyl-L-alanine amidase [candidate division KSB1 bacterium]MDZ7376740.1 N-acetylmuramoyl-L-alanine amidase [candidate division KSB1 bacterium]MDZ7401830.1 N-acetylmuramoyl-L-alanine amidase [candidate division KSB1 bacterium]
MLDHLFLKMLLFITLLLFFITVVFGQTFVAQLTTDPYAPNKIKTFTNNNLQYLSANDLARLLNAQSHFDVQSGKFIVQIQNRVLKLCAFSPFVQLDQKIYQLPAEIELIDQNFYAPLPYFIELFDQLFPNRIRYNQLNSELEINPFNAINITQITIEEKANGTLVSIMTTRRFSESELSLRSGPNFIYLDIYGGRVDSLALYGKYKTGLIAEIIPSQVTNELAQIGFRLRQDIIEKSLLLQNPNQILISLKTKVELPKNSNKNIDVEKRKWLIDRIVIDPGHGGRDPGAIGKLGTKEKDVVLGIAHHLKELLEENLGVEVLMTREDDRFVPLNQRTEFANRHQAKLFISIHANSNRNRRINGVSTYFLGPENTEEAREVASLENSVISLETESKYADLSQEKYILSAIAQNVYNIESQDLAAIVQREISRECNLQDLGVKQAGFYVLWGASMPNILIETAFISNPDEEKLLRSKSFQKKQALAIYRSIKQFKERYESQI